MDFISDKSLVPSNRARLALFNSIFGIKAEEFVYCISNYEQGGYIMILGKRIK
jgi:hypothetical protein